MNQQTFEHHLRAELDKIGCGYTVTVEDVMREFAALRTREQAAALDPEALALVITNNIQESGIMELIHTAVHTAVLDLLAEDSGTDRVVWDDAMSANDETLLIEMIKSGRTQEVLHG